MKIIADCTTGELVERELTAEEIAIEKLDHEKLAIIEAARQEAEAAKAAEKAALLERLGITQDEAKLLLS